MKPLRFCLLFFQYACGAALAWKPSIELEQTLEGLWTRARAPWGTIDLSVEEYFHYLAERWPGERAECSPADLSREVHLSDLYLACACMNRLPGAIEALEKNYFARLAAQLLGKYPADVVDEALQRLREKLLVGAVDRPAKLASYKGEGNLSSFLLVIANREASDLLRKHDPLEGNAEEVDLEALAASGADPDLAILMERYREELRGALHAAFNALGDTPKTLLRLRYVDRLSLPKIGVLYDVHHTTILRWLTEALGEVHERTKRQLKEHLSITSQEFDGLVSSLRSHLELSLSWLLTSPKKKVDPA